MKRTTSSRLSMTHSPSSMGYSSSDHCSTFTVNMSKSMQNTRTTWHRLRVSIQPSYNRNFTASTGPLRELAIACFSTKLARLTRAMNSVGMNTYVEQIQAWRDNGFTTYGFYHLIRKEGENARQILDFLVAGSPALRLILHQIKVSKVLDPLNSKRHQKLLIGEATPLCAWMIEVALRSLLIDARVFHSQLSNQQRAEMVRVFNDPQSTLKLLIMTYEVGAVGLNLHESCDQAVISSIARSRPQESQLAGRVCWVSFGRRSIVGTAKSQN
jgi:hypothetical protein